ncbi:hypothetical protein ALT785_290018 [Alteromonas infernus]
MEFWTMKGLFAKGDIHNNTTITFYLITL